VNDGAPTAVGGGVIGVIGVGALASAIVTGLCDGVERPPQVLLSPRGAEIAASLASRYPSVEVAPDNQSVADAAQVVLVCVRPQDAEAVLGGLELSAEHVVVSAVAGVSLDELAGLARPATRVARAMPLPSVAGREGLTPVHPARPEVLDLFERLGGALPVDDGDAFDALVATAATLAGHLAYLGAIVSWLVAQGVPRDEAQRYVTATYGALARQLTGGADLGELTAEVSTPGGLNEQFAAQLSDAGVYDAVGQGLSAVLVRLTA
jgi:pyrroline-5-carboxylate reductase